MIDWHVHIGQFEKKYFEPALITSDIVSFGIKKFYVSSTTVCDDSFNFEYIEQELNLAVTASNRRALPILWLRPDWLDSVDLFVDKLNCFYKMLKIHPLAHEWLSSKNNKRVKKVFQLSVKHKLPVMIHTGGGKECDAGKFLNICQSNPESTIILAHGRPIEQAIEVMQQCNNVFVDTAYMPNEAIKMLEKSGLSDRTLFGSDYPLDTVYYPESDLRELYKKRLNFFSKTIHNSYDLDHLPIFC